MVPAEKISTIPMMTDANQPQFSRPIMHMKPVPMTASVATVLVLTFLGQWPMAILFGLMTLLLYLRHAENIGRLRRGEESRIGGTKQRA